MLRPGKLWELIDHFMAVIQAEAGFPVLIYDADGYIVRATDDSRIGDLHAGAEKIMHHLADEYAVTAQEAQQNPLVKEGYSCPIIIDGKRVAGFGITGKLELTKPLARTAVQMVDSWVESHRYQKQLEWSELKYRNLFDNSLNGIFQATLDGQYMTVNASMARILGYASPDELLTDITDIGKQLYVNPHDRTLLIEALLKEKRTSGSIVQMRRRDGRTIHLSIDAQLIYDPDTGERYIEGHLEDISERNQREKAQRQRFERIQRQQNALIELAGNHAIVNSEFETATLFITGLMARTLRVEQVSVWLFANRQSSIECVDQFTLSSKQHTRGAVLKAEDYPDYFRTQAQELIIAAEDAQRDPRTIELAEGYLIPLGITSMLDVAFRAEGEAIGIICHEHIGDIRSWPDDEIAFARAVADQLALLYATTQRKLQEKEVRHLRTYLSNIIDSMPSVLVGVDTEIRVTQWNRRAEETTGLSFDSVRSQPLGKVFPRLANQVARIDTAIQDRQVVRDLKVPVRHHGDTYFEDITIFPLVTDGTSGAVIRVDDVTEQVRLEEIMIQNEKMLSVGGLAAGMAHEINNPLAGILQNTSVLHHRLFGDLPANRKAADAAGTTMEAIRRYFELRKLTLMLDNIRTSGKRAATIVKNMLSFARKSDHVFSHHRLGVLLDQTIELARTDYNMKKRYDFKQIEIVRDYDDNIVPVPCDASKLQQVFLNILKNGAEAMTAMVNNARHPTFTVRVKTDGHWACAEIQDNGPGMDEKVRIRVFEPFYTNKPTGVGTGLGLSVSYFIITENHGGQLWVTSTPGEGTTFIIRLPIENGKMG